MHDCPLHPGNVFKSTVLEKYNITVTDAAYHLGITRKALSEFINEKSKLSPEMALRISKVFGTSPTFWMTIQTELDIWNAKQKEYKVTPFFI